jgi:RNA polymerase-interacting CarD/CdnL/TRCF family regulator
LYGYEATYAKIYFERDDLTFTLLEKDLLKTVRILISADEAKKLLKHIETWDGKAKSQWKARAEAHQAAIDGGDPFKYARVVKELNRMDSEEELRPRDKANLAHALGLITEEITESLNKTPAQAAKLIQKALNP